MSLKSKLQFIAWTQSRYPAVFNAALKKIGIPVSKLAGFGNSVTSADMIASQDAFAGAFDAATTAPATTTNAAPSLLDQATTALTSLITNLAPVYASSQQAKTCIQVNAQRAGTGLAPVDCSTAGLAPQVAIGVSPGVSTILWVTVGLVGVGLLMTFKRKRR